jgi:hypothetical protein
MTQTDVISEKAVKTNAENVTSHRGWNLSPSDCMPTMYKYANDKAKYSHGIKRENGTPH